MDKRRSAIVAACCGNEKKTDIQAAKMEENEGVNENGFGGKKHSSSSAGMDQPCTQDTNASSSSLGEKRKNSDDLITESPYALQGIKLIPEGGWGWAICAAAFLSQFIVLGIHNSFGILFTFLLEEFGKSKAATAWVGSASVGILYLFGPITCGLNERIGFRTISFIGGALCGLGMLLTSFVTELPKIYVTYSLLWGIGSSLCYFSTLTVPGEYFCRRLSLVNGIITAGSGLGTLTFGPLLQYLLKLYGLATTLRILAGVMSVLMATSLCYKPFRSPLEQLYDIKRVPGPFLDLRVWKNKAFVIYTAAVSLFMLGYFIPYVHIVSLVVGLGISSSKGAMLIGFMSISSTVSRIVFGRFSDHPRVNRLYMTQFAIIGFGITTTLCPIVKTYSAFVAVMVMLGLFDGMYVVLIAVVVTDIVGVHKLNQALGNLYGVISVAITVGPPFAGLLYDALLSYNTAFYICGATTALSSLLMFFIPWLTSKNKGGRFQRDSIDSRFGSLLTTSLTHNSREISSIGRGGTIQDDSRSEREKDRNRSASKMTKDSSEGREDEEDLDVKYLCDYDDNEENSDDLSINTSKNTSFNSSMSHRGSITRVLLSHQLATLGTRSASPISSARQEYPGCPANTSSARGNFYSSTLVSMKAEKHNDDGKEEMIMVESVV